MNRIIKLIITLIVATALNTFILMVLRYNMYPDVKSIKVLKYDEEKDIIVLELEKDQDYILNYDFSCVVKDKNNVYTQVGKKNKCTFELPLNQDYTVAIKNRYSHSRELNALDYIDNKLDFKFDKDLIYLAVDEKQSITYTDKFILPVDLLYEFYSNDESIAKVEDGKIVGVNEGITTIGVKGNKDTLKVIVTDLISKPTLVKSKKEIVPCNKYSEDEAELLDKLLEYYIEEAGYKTRAGAVAAGRFLTLQFKYRIPYFYENGRINDSGVHKADGEGRYYKKGLYLHENKFANIIYTYADKAIWGCPLKNGSNNPKYGYIAGKKMPNGLDCSGFVSWALVNGGFDPGDVGAGENEGIYQLTDTGDFTPLTKELAMSGKIKTGDLFNFWGHIALIIGQDDNNYYVAESLPHLGGVIAKTYPKKTVTNTFEFVVFMDTFYKEDGNLQDYWE